jgi:hypothetical protein
LLYPQKNLLKPFTDPSWQKANPFTVVGDYEATLTSSTPAWDTTKIYVDVEVGKTYTLQALVEGEFSVEVWENNKNFGAFAKKTFQSRSMVASYPVWEIRIVRDGQATGFFRVKEVMLAEGKNKSEFEPYKLGNARPTLYPSNKGNLIPDFNDKGWVQDTKVAGTSSFTVDPVNPYKATMSISESAQGRLIAIPVTSGKSYTFSFGNMTGLYRLLKGKTESYNNVPIIGQDQQNYKFTPDDTYGGYVTLRLTHGAGGAYLFENLQLVEGAAVPFSPMKKTNDKATLSPDKNLIPSLKDSRWTLIADPVTKIIDDYVMTTSAVTGINAINVPVRSGTTYTFKTENPDAAIYFIDSYNDKDVSLTRHTFPAGNVNDTLTFTTSAGAVYVRIIFRNNGTTGKVCTWKNMQLVEGSLLAPFKPYVLANKQAKFIPKKNLVKLDPNTWTKRTGTTSTTFTGDRVDFDATLDYAGVQVMLDDSMFAGKQITFGGERSEGCSILFYYLNTANGQQSYIGLASYENKRTLSVPATAAQCRFYVQNNVGVRGNHWARNLFVNYGTDETFEVYKDVNPPAVLVPQKNLLKGFKDITLNNFELVTLSNDYKATYKAVSPTTSNSYWLFEPKINTDYTFSMNIPADMALGVYNEDASKQITAYTYGGEVTFNSGTYKRVRLYVRNAVQGSVFEISNPQLEVGTKRTEFKPYTLGNPKL